MFDICVYVCLFVLVIVVVVDVVAGFDAFGYEE